MQQSHRPPTKRKEVYRLNAFEALFSAAWSNKVSMHIVLGQGSQVTKPGKKDNIMRKKGHQQSQLRKKRTKFFIVYFH